MSPRPSSVLPEIDRGLHPDLTAQIIGLFRNPETNPLGAQMMPKSERRGSAKGNRSRPRS